MIKQEIVLRKSFTGGSKKYGCVKQYRNFKGQKRCKIPLASRKKSLHHHHHQPRPASRKKSLHHQPDTGTIPSADPRNPYNDPTLPNYNPDLDKKKADYTSQQKEKPAPPPPPAATSQQKEKPAPPPPAGGY